MYTVRGVIGVRRDNPVTTYLSDEEKAQLERWAAETEKSQAHLLREAVLEYLDHDRTARIEAEVREINDTLEHVLEAVSDSDNTHTHGHVPQSPSTERARKMIRQLQSEQDAVMKATAVELKIENPAGADDRTIAKYKTIFRKRGLLFEHPGEPPLWTTDREQFEKWLRQYGNMNGPGPLKEFLEPYPADCHPAGDGHEIVFEEVDA